MKDSAALISRLAESGDLTDAELSLLLQSSAHDAALFRAADAVRRKTFGNAVYIRGLLEISNYCVRGCRYCGIRKGSGAARYRLSPALLLDCCVRAYGKGFRTFVLQAGEDPFFGDDSVCGMVRSIKQHCPDAAVTLSLGERSRESYQAFFDAGADRYLLRHETADTAHYARLHPEDMSLERRKECLFVLKSIGFQVGSGFLVGSPWQRSEHLARDIRFLQELKPEMIGIGPFIAHHATPLRAFPNGGLDLTLRLIAVLRLLFPEALIPATTALASLSPEGRALGLQAGANVIMPNISPPDYRKFYDLYDNKVSTGCESAEGMAELEAQVLAAGYALSMGRGDAPSAGRIYERCLLAG